MTMTFSTLTRPLLTHRRTAATSRALRTPGTQTEVWGAAPGRSVTTLLTRRQARCPRRLGRKRRRVRKQHLPPRPRLVRRRPARRLARRRRRRRVPLQSPSLHRVRRRRSARLRRQRSRVSKLMRSLGWLSGRRTTVQTAIVTDSESLPSPWQAARLVVSLPSAMQCTLAPWVFGVPCRCRVRGPRMSTATCLHDKSEVQLAESAPLLTSDVPL